MLLKTVYREDILMSFFFIAGILLILAGAGNFIIDFLQRKQCSSHTTGTLIYVDEQADMGINRQMFRTCYVPVYEYEVNGEVFQIRSEEYSQNSAEFKLGAPADIRYNPSNPKEAIANNHSKHSVVGYILLGAGVVLFLLGM